MAGPFDTSSVLGKGAWGTVHTSPNGAYGAVKLAAADKQSLALIENEFHVLAQLAGCGLPVPAIDPEPIVVDGVLRGYRMELLRLLTDDGVRARREDIRAAIARLHGAGFCHGDVSRFNTMQDAAGRIVLIDFGFAGRIGEVVPLGFGDRVYRDGVFVENVDWLAFDCLVPWQDLRGPDEWSHVSGSSEW